MRAAKILIVEDDEDQQRILSDTLRFRNYEVVQARDGLEAMQRIEEDLPDLIVLDVRLPHIDGFSLAEILKKDPKTARIPVLAVTLYDIDIRQRISAPWDSLRMKPLPPDELIAEVERLLKGVVAEDANGSDGPLPAS
ncbi:MAG: response regulator [Longimicrobiales bacterium]